MRIYQIKHFPFDGARDWFKQADSDKLAVVLATDDYFVNSKQTEAFLERECKAVKVETMKGLHELCLFRPEACF